MRKINRIYLCKMASTYIHDEKFILIRNLAFFADLTDEDFERLNMQHHFKEVKEGEYIYFENYLSKNLYFVKGGYIKIGTIDDNGNEVVKEIIGPGEIFGQYTLEQNSKDGEYAKAYKSDISLCTFTIKDFEQLLAYKPELALRYTRLVGQKTRTFENRLSGMLLKDVKTRLAKFLVDNFAMYPEGEAVENVLTHEDIASLIGSSRQTVTSTLNSFAKYGVIQFDRNTINILNKNILNNFAMSAS
jgi:CRP/FNR family transcriptional regulator, cyclic AMP receptor protein